MALINFVACAGRYVALQNNPAGRLSQYFRGVYGEALLAISGLWRDYCRHLDEARVF